MIVTRLKKLFYLLTRRDKVFLLVSLFVMLLAAALEIVSIGSVPVLISLIANPEVLTQYAIGQEIISFTESVSRTQLFLWAGIGFFLIFVARTTVLIFNTYLLLRFRESRQVRLSHQLFRRYMAAAYEFHLQNDSSALMRNVQQGALRIGGEIITSLLLGVQHVILLIAIVLLLFTTKPTVTFVAIFVFGLFGLAFTKFTSSKSRVLGAVQMRERKNVIHVLRQGLEGVKEIQLLHKQGFFVKSFTDSVRSFARTERVRSMIVSIAGPLMELLAIAALLMVATILVAAGEDLAGVSATLAMFALAFVRMKSSLSACLGAYTNLNFHLVNVDPVFDDLRSLSVPAPTTNREERDEHKVKLTKSIQFENVGYQYPGTDTLVLQEADLEIPKGACVGIVGRTGAGKSTFVDILLGILSPTQGQVRVDGADIHEDLNAWQRDIGYVPQDIFLTDDTIRRNVALGIVEDRIDEIEVRRALGRAQLLEFIETLPKKAQSRVGERGVKLSGGQKQRIGIARALYRSPDVLVLDEATASLDSATENQLMQAVKELKGEITIVIVAHRLSTVKECDVLFVLEKGKVCASGTYDELLAASGDFRRIAVV